MNTTLIAVLVSAAACGGTSKQESAAHTEDEGRMATMGQHHEVGQGAMHDRKPAMAPQLATFHDMLAPRWHAAPGPQRMADACAAVPQFHAGAEAIAAAEPPPGADVSAWSTGGRELIEAIAALDATCKAKDAAAFDVAFERVHNSFHGIMEAADRHGERQE